MQHALAAINSITRPLGLALLLILITAASSSAKSRDVIVSFAGDCTFGSVNGDSGGNRFPAVYRRSQQSDYPFALVQKWFRSDDLSIVNFECTLTQASITANKQWHFKGDAKYALIFPRSSVEAVDLANNHSHDYLQAGFDDTVKNFQSARMPLFYQDHPYTTKINGIQTVVIGDCTVVGENTTKLDGVSARVLRQIVKYKTPATLVIVFMHWGSELAKSPFLWQQTMARQFIDAGADAVVGAHPHVLQGIEVYKGKCIAYSLGNFAFGGNSLARNPDTCILRLRFSAEDHKIVTEPPFIVPCIATSTQKRNSAGVLLNNYQPKPFSGAQGAAVVNLIIKRSSELPNGVKQIGYSH